MVEKSRGRRKRSSASDRPMTIDRLRRDDATATARGSVEQSQGRADVGQSRGRGRDLRRPTIARRTAARGNATTRRRDDATTARRQCRAEPVQSRARAGKRQSRAEAEEEIRDARPSRDERAPEARRRRDDSQTAEQGRAQKQSEQVQQSDRCWERADSLVVVVLVAGVGVWSGWTDLGFGMKRRRREEKRTRTTGREEIYTLES